ncbi:MAG: hypothetical protein CR982_08755 [Candidatus Cloacimonadota bacterium]|nr:MAG: hypothetical protein CR982_08755 [Candidatus Cloacimonadota bacterium]PIE77723.1 MAG: hypothetical protein CSA15_11410 [Candidatus Delongbacteria bacterium]
MDKNSIIGFVLIALVMIFSSYFFQPPENSENSAIEKVAMENDSIVSGETNNSFNERNNITINKNSELIPQEEIRESEIVVENDLFIGKFSSKGGAVTSFELKKFKSREDENKGVNLVHPEGRNLITKIELTDGQLLENLNYRVSNENITLSGTDSKEIVFEALDSEGNILYKKIYKFYGDKYNFDVKVEPVSIKGLIKEGGVSILWPDGMNFTEVSKDGKNLNGEEWFLNSYCYDSEGELTEFNNSDEAEVSGKFLWGATRSKYFETFIYAKTPKFDNFTTYRAPEGINYLEEKYSSIGFEIGYRDNDNIEFSVYSGPMEYDLFKEYGLDFQSTLNWGWDIVRPFSWLVLKSIKLFHPIIPNYGWLIIFLSLIINALLLPFNIKAFKSTVAMKKIQPYVKEVKEKFPGDLQRQQQETMALYKKHGVNPFGSCLPSLLPMPILYGFFIVFRSTIDIRDQGFALWLTDLSLPEVFITLPFNIPLYGGHIGLLPLIMAVFSYLQMKDTITDPNQKMMAYMMPAMLLIFFNNFASGLILYYTVGTIFRYFQQLFTKKSLAKG